MERKGRSELREIFSRGSLPTELHFRTLIDSILNLEDDDFQSLLDGPLKIYSLNDRDNPGSKKTVLEFYNTIEETEEKPAFKLQLDKEGDDGVALKLVDKNEEEILTISPSKKVRIHSTETTIEGSTYLSEIYGNLVSNVPADGAWHSILSELTGCQSYEVTACVGSHYVPNSEYAITKASALLIPWKPHIWDFLFPERQKVHMLQNHTGTSRNKIDLRWKRTGQTYELQVRTRKDYGGNAQIMCRIMKSFSDEFMSENKSH